MSRQHLGRLWTRAALPSAPDDVSRPPQCSRQQARLDRSSECQDHFCGEATVERLPPEVRLTEKPSSAATGELMRPGVSPMDLESKRAASACKLATWFTDSEWFFLSARRNPSVSAKTVKSGSARPRQTSERRDLSKTSSGHQRESLGTSGAAYTASDGPDGRPGAFGRNPGAGKGLTFFLSVLTVSVSRV